MRTTFKKIRVKGIEYAQYENGFLIPMESVRESATISKPVTLIPLLADLALAQQEHFLTFTLDGHHHVVKRHICTIGLANQSQIHPREVFKPAYLDHAVSIIVAHNHPSGHLLPSEADLQATKRLVAASKILGIPVLDHLIFHGSEVYSIREFYPGLWDAV